MQYILLVLPCAECQYFFLINLPVLEMLEEEEEELCWNLPIVGI